MENSTPTLSIVTPAYNRGKLLRNCYESLQKQTCMDFEWIVVDDGSTDFTEEVMADIKSEIQSFDIIYVQKKNGGKHTALNASHPFIKGRYVLILDSDDYLVPEAVNTVLENWANYADDMSIGLITFLRCNNYGQWLAYAKDENIPVDILNYQRVCVLSSDCCEVIRTELFKKYKFPVFKNENFVAETALWYKVGIDYKTIYVNKAVYVCEYLEGGLTESGRKMRIKNPKGGMYTSYLRMNKRCSIKERVRAALLYVCYGHFAECSVRRTFKNAKPYQLLVLLCYIPGTAMYQLWKKKY